MCQLSYLHLRFPLRPNDACYAKFWENRKEIVLISQLLNDLIFCQKQDGLCNIYDVRKPSGCAKRIYCLTDQ